LGHITAKRLLWVLALVVVVGFAAPRTIARETAEDACTEPSNPIACENSYAGNPRAEWDLAGSGSPTIRGFATDISVNHGETVHFKINSPASSYRLDIYRLGYYGGLGARRVATVLPAVTLPQAQPACAIEAATGLVDCGTWSVSAWWAVPANAVSGVYLAKLVRTDGVAGDNHIVFVVRDDDGQSDLLVETSDTTWQAHNAYGGSSLFEGPAGRAYKVSYNRPFTTRIDSPRHWLLQAEYPMLRWLEANGYHVSYTTAHATDRAAGEILEHRAFLSLGYDEFWSAAQRTHVEAARAAGVHLAFFGAKTSFWKHRWESAFDGGDRRTLVSYRETLDNSKIDPAADQWTGTWRDPRFSPPADGGRSEQALTGVAFAVNAGGVSSIEVPAAFGGLRFWRNTAIATLAADQVGVLPAGTLSDEWDEAPLAGRPSGLLTMSHTRRTVPNRLLDFGSMYGTGTGTHTLAVYRDPASHALIFAAGTAHWSWGLDTWPDRAAASLDLRMQQATLNLLSDMGALPSTPQPGLIVSAPGDDEMPPVSSIALPLSGATLPSGTPVIIQGTASDAGGNVAVVEVSTDGGATWTTAAGTTTWSFQWTPTTSGPAIVMSRAFDDSANAEIPAGGTSITVTDPVATACPCTLWHPDTLPRVADAGADSPVELGVKFQAKVRGYITGVRFYKSAANTGAHVGNLWSNTGVQLASVTFTGETASGWQTAAFSTPVAVEPNVTYVASYHTTTGHYGFAENYFISRGVDSGPLRALAGPANGVYRYGAASRFPYMSYTAANYWVDVVFDANAADTAPPGVATVSPSDGAFVVSSTAISVTFDDWIAAGTINANTVDVHDSTGQLVTVSIAHQPSSRRVVLTPSAPLQNFRSYTVRLHGGSGGITDQAGNPMAADYQWRFSTGASPSATPIDGGPGGPILIVASDASPFSRYYAEILRAEGLTAFAVMDLSAVSPAVLNDYDVVVLGRLTLSAAQVTMFTNWVDGGGHLIAMRPDKQLAPLLGLSDTGGVLTDQYLAIDTSTAPGAGLVDSSIQFHGSADLYTAPQATTIATLYANATDSAARPAVTVRQVGTHGGQAAAFTYDLARSVVYTRQGNPAWAGQERDGIAPIRPTDMFWGTAGQRHWIDLDKVAIPQADEQQRLLANLILQMNATRRPLPRFWYLPRGLKAAVMMTGDDHGFGGSAPRFASFLAASPANCSVDRWECIRATAYVYPTGLGVDQAKGLDALGFEFGLHFNTGCANVIATPAALSWELSQWNAYFLGLGTPTSNRTHCLVWSDWSSQASTSAAAGVRMDSSYYYWPASWAANRPGLFTGSGMPMRFATTAGAPIDVYQAATQITDESNQNIPATIATLLDRATGPEGYYGVFTANMHGDFAQSDAADAIVAAARARGVPVVSSRQMLTWLDGRNATTYRALTWDGTVLRFAVELGAGARDIDAMVPMFAGTDRVWTITADEAPVAYRQETIKGVTYAIFTAASASYAITYGPPSSTVGGVVSVAETDAPLPNVTVSAYRPDGALAFSTVTDSGGAYRLEGMGDGTFFLRTFNQQDYIDQVFSGVSCAAECIATAGNAVSVDGSSPGALAHFRLSGRPQMVYPTVNATDVSPTRDFQWRAVPGADAYIVQIGTAPNTWDVLADGLLTQTTYRVTRVLPIGRTLYARAGARVGGDWRWSTSVPFTAARTTAALLYPAANATNVSLWTDFEWTPVPNADAYILHIGTAPNTWDVVAAGLLTGTTYRVTVSVPIDRPLYARVGSRVGGIWRWADSVPFTAARATATLIYPAANATGVLLSQNFEWLPVSGADAYILHIGTAPNTWDVLAAGLLTQTSYRVGTVLPSDRTLYARVGARVNGIWRWTDSSPFTAAATVATMTYPAMNAADVVLSRPFEWTAVPSADAYILHVGTAPNTYDVLAAGLLTQPRCDIPVALPTGQTLYARVGSRVGGVWRWSANTSFTATAATATVTYPAANAAGIVLTRDFEWTPVSGADAYIVHVGSTPNAWDVLADGLLTQPSYRVVKTLPSDRTLYLRIGSRVGGIWRWSNSTPFTAVPSTASMTYPTANATNVGATPNFTWAPVTGADAYVLHIGTAANTWDVVAAGLLTQPAYQLTTPLPAGRTLYTRVGTRVGGVWRWSDSIPFTTAQ
jgi:hypothetical protein